MSIDPVKIPQNVYIEDRIVGPLTLHQIIISMIGIGFSYAIWASIAKVYGYVPWYISVIVWIPGLLSVIFAFVRINDLSMAHLLLLFIERTQKPQTRIYGPRRGLTVNTRSFNVPTTHNQKVSATLPQAEGDIGKLSAFLDHEEGEENAPDDTQGSAIPLRPVQKGRITVTPLSPDDIEQLATPGGQRLFHDILHPPASHA